MQADTDGFREFYLGSRRELSRAAFFLTGDLSDAEDLLQDALVKAAMRWPRIGRMASPEAYVRTIMLNAVRSRWRRHRRLAEVPTARIDDRAAELREDSTVLERDELARHLRRLGPRQRAVLFLRFYLDLSEAATAEQLGCSVGTVKSQTHDAIARLRAHAGTTDLDLRGIGNE